MFLHGKIFVSISDPQTATILKKAFKARVLYCSFYTPIIPIDFDVVGHYSRPEIFQLVVNEEKKEHVKWMNR
ncbi:hypothetical protein BN2127_JRS3_02381 [Bacillus safensis]|nr:hypothetical protein BN2127_JRS3_02381 [Bacillus safensis]